MLNYICIIFSKPIVLFLKYRLYVKAKMLKIGFRPIKNLIILIKVLTGSMGT